MTSAQLTQREGPRGRQLDAALVLLAFTLLFPWPILHRAGISTGLSAATAVKLNEFLPRPCPLTASQTFIELYNSGSETVNLGGWKLSVDSAFYIIPAGVWIAGGAYRAFYASTTSLSFPPEGEVRLLDAAGTFTDVKRFTGPQCNLAFGLYPNGGIQWYENLVPSPGGRNTLPLPTVSPTGTRTATRAPTNTSPPPPSATQSIAVTRSPMPVSKTPTRPLGTPSASPPGSTASTTPSPGTSTPGVRAQPCLSEFMPAPYRVDWDGDGKANYADEWIELYNPCTGEIDLQGWQLDDRGGGGSRPYTFPAGSRLGSGAFGVYYQRQTGLALNNDGDDVRLVDPLGREVDRASYTLTAADVSYSRLGRCGGPWAMDQAPSPGQPNPTPPALYLPLICRR